MEYRYPSINEQRDYPEGRPTDDGTFYLECVKAAKHIAEHEASGIISGDPFYGGHFHSNED